MSLADEINPSQCRKCKVTVFDDDRAGVVGKSRFHRRYRKLQQPSEPSPSTTIIAQLPGIRTFVDPLRGQQLQSGPILYRCNIHRIYDTMYYTSCPSSALWKGR